MQVVWNVPNRLTAFRLLLAPFLFAAVAMQYYLAGLILFSIAAFTDWLDGWWARTFNQITQLGRILDPLADKLVVCGCFILLGGVEHSGIVPWMAVIVVGRELIVTALRSFVEEQGIDFSASLAGKAKMVVQCAAIIAAFLEPIWGKEVHFPYFLEIRAGLIWLAIGITLYSGAEYLVAAARLLFFAEPKNESGADESQPESSR